MNKGQIAQDNYAKSGLVDGICPKLSWREVFDERRVLRRTLPALSISKKASSIDIDGLGRERERARTQITFPLVFTRVAAAFGAKTVRKEESGWHR